MNLLISLRAEILKTKRTASLYVTLGAAAFGPLMSMLDIIFDGVDEDNKAIILEKMFTSKFQMTGLVIFPFFLILICTLLPQIEYKNNTWKQVLTSPQKKGTIFIAKFISIQLLSILFLLVNTGLVFVNTVILHFMQPALHVFSQAIDIHKVAKGLLNTYVALLALSSIQFWMGLRFKNFIAPIGIGVACWFVGSILVVQSFTGIASFFPYSFHIYGKFPQYHPEVNAVGLISGIYTVVFLVIGYLDFTRRNIAI